MFEKPHDATITGSEFEPWITRESIDMLKMMLKSDFIGLEWGCGASSIWFLEKIGFLYTIEHDFEWKNKVEQYIVKNRPHLLDKWKLYYEKEDDFPSNELLYIDGNGVSRKNYCLIVENIQEEFDFVCVDGRSRKGCIAAIISKIKKENGIFVLDNSERQEYYPNAIPDSWEKIETNNGVWSTTIWITKK